MEFICNQCPRKCGAIRTDEIGYGCCKSPALPRLARAALHMWEEPCISGKNGSGTVFFSGCSLNCIFCQNYSISHATNDIPYGKTITVEHLHEIFVHLEQLGAHNINLVNPTHYTHTIYEVLTKFPRPNIPIVYNTGGYDDIDSLRHLDGLIDIYLPDLKYKSTELSEKLASAPNYFEIASNAIFEMYRQVGSCISDRHDILQKGVIVRHLVLPGFVGKSLDLLEWCRVNLPKGVRLSVMSQYTPCGEISKYKTLSRRLNKAEYSRIVDFLLINDMTDGYIQELSSASEEYIPPFNLDGI